MRGAGPSAFAGAQLGGNAGTAPGGTVQAGGAGTIPPEQFRRAPGQQEVGKGGELNATPKIGKIFV